MHLPRSGRRSLTSDFHGQTDSVPVIVSAKGPLLEKGDGQRPGDGLPRSGKRSLTSDRLTVYRQPDSVPVIASAKAFPLREGGRPKAGGWIAAKRLKESDV